MNARGPDRFDPVDLVVEDLACARGGIAILGGINFVLKPGKVLVLRGANGSGKTTLLRTIAGLQPALTGSVRGAEDRIAYGAHADGLKSALTVEENLAFWAGVYGTGTLDAAVLAFGLRDLMRRRVQNLSAGQKRRLGLAWLLVTGRPVWVLDEPTVSLDAVSVEKFGKAIARHLEQGGSALIATHIDLGVEAEELDVSRYRATRIMAKDVFDEAFG